ncbi:MAG TPA: hypothetical protein VMW24_01435 [Sedimentisphaerales bacterium]|nr:hypothetical protein [Sedimentisphaerales bacterium]
MMFRSCRDIGKCKVAMAVPTIATIVSVKAAAAATWGPKRSSAPA